MPTLLSLDAEDAGVIPLTASISDVVCDNFDVGLKLDAVPSFAYNVVASVPLNVAVCAKIVTETR